MTLLLYKSLAALLIFLISIVTVIYPLRKKITLQHTEGLGLGEALASGIFLGAAFFHMLPDSIKIFGQLYPQWNYPIPEVICVGGFLFLLLLERLSISRTTVNSKHSIPYILAITLIIHALTEGAALGIGATFSEISLLFIAILAHKGSESFALCVTLLRHQLPLRRVIFIVIFFAFMTPLGIGLGEMINELAIGHRGELVAAIFDAFVAGTFLYISTLHHIHFHQHEKDPRSMLEYISLVIGAGMMGVIALWT